MKILKKSLLGDSTIGFLFLYKSKTTPFNPNPIRNLQLAIVPFSVIEKRCSPPVIEYLLDTISPFTLIVSLPRIELNISILFSSK